MKKPRRWVTAVLLLLTMTQFAHAQVERRGGEANGMLLQQIQELTSEHASLQAENARLKKQVDDLTKQRDQLKSAQRTNDQRVRNDAAALAQSSAQHTSDEKDLQLYKQRMQELVDKFRETIETLRRTEIESATFKDAVAARDREIKVCMDRNATLYRLNAEVLTHWEKQSLWSRLARSDPFTRIAQTRLENMADDYRSRADEQRLSPDSLKAAASALPPAPRAPAAATPPSSVPSAPGGGRSAPAAQGVAPTPQTAPSTGGNAASGR